MSEISEKLRPDRDLQCYFERPSAVAALSSTSASGFTVSGSWRQQFDWVVVEWNRDNVFEHPRLRNLPDGDLSGLHLTYEEIRQNCIPMDSALYPTVDWPYLRVWVPSGSDEVVFRVPLRDHATPIEGDYVAASADFTLSGVPVTGDYAGLSFLSEHHTYQVYAGDTLADIVTALAASVTRFSPVMQATANADTIHLTYPGSDGKAGANGNRVGVYSYTSGSGTCAWNSPAQTLSGGQSPGKWRVDLDFSNLLDVDGKTVPTGSVRKLRWTWAAELQPEAFQRSEFQAVVSSWSVTGSGRTYQVAGPAGFRLENDSNGITYHGSWSHSKGNFSGGSISYCTSSASGLIASYESRHSHELWLGTRRAPNAGSINLTLDGQPLGSQTLKLAGEDVLVRVRIASCGAGSHTVAIDHGATEDEYFYFDFLEVVVPVTDLPDFSPEPKLTLATDWDTDHSVALAPERTAWLVRKLGFLGRANHYVGALWFYEMVAQDYTYATGTFTFSGDPAPNSITQVSLGYVNAPPGSQSVIQHLHHAGDTAETIAKAFELILNNGYTAVWASAQGPVLRLQARAPGIAGNSISIDGSTNAPGFSVVRSAPTLEGGQEGTWVTDLAATPRVNRAARDWCRSYYSALTQAGVDVVAAFSMELQNGDTSVAAGIAQRYPSGAAVTLNTPAVQTNFSPASAAFWKQVYLDMANVMMEAGATPYLQFGEVQWWYFPYDKSGMPFCDDFTKSSFLSRYGRPIRTVPDGDADPAAFAEEAAFLPELIGNFTDQVMSYVRASVPTCRFEVLYPTDVNAGAFNAVVNYPAAHWTPAALDCIKTESFTYTLGRNLDQCRASMHSTAQRGFPRSKRSHLVGISDESTPWSKEARMAEGEVGDSVVLFALDQFCLIGYRLPTRSPQRRIVDAA